MWKELYNQITGSQKDRSTRTSRKQLSHFGLRMCLNVLLNVQCRCRRKGQTWHDCLPLKTRLAAIIQGELKRFSEKDENRQDTITVVKATEY